MPLTTGVACPFSSIIDFRSRPEGRGGCSRRRRRRRGGEGRGRAGWIGSGGVGSTLCGGGNSGSKHEREPSVEGVLRAGEGHWREQVQAGGRPHHHARGKMTKKTNYLIVECSTGTGTCSNRTYTPARSLRYSTWSSVAQKLPRVVYIGGTHEAEKSRTGYSSTTYLVFTMMCPSLLAYLNIQTYYTKYHTNERQENKRLFCFSPPLFNPKVNKFCFPRCSAFINPVPGINCFWRRVRTHTVFTLPSCGL